MRKFTNKLRNKFKTLFKKKANFYEIYFKCKRSKAVGFKYLRLTFSDITQTI